MATVEDLLRQAAEAQGQISGLKERLSHAQSYTERVSLQSRIRKLQDRLDSLYAAYLRAMDKPPVTVFGTRKKPKTTAGLQVTMDVSTDGRYFSNPAPKISHVQRVWVRAQIDMAQKSPFSTVKTEIPTLIRCTWVIPRGWTVLDRYSRFGRVEHVVSLPLVVTREFKAPGSGSTKAKFGMFADPYYQVDTDLEPPDSADVEITTTTADIEAGSYVVYTRTGDVLSDASTLAFPETTVVIDEADERLYYTDGATYRVVRVMLTGPYPGKYIDVAQGGITLTENIGSPV